MILIGDYIIQPTVFPDGTQQVWKLPLDQMSGPVQVTWYYKNQDEIMSLLQLDELLVAHHIPYHLSVGFLPFARQDKDISNETTFGLHPFLKVLGLLSYNVIHIMHPHSDAVLSLRSVNVIRELEPFLLKDHNIVFPDKGSFHNYKSVLRRGMPYVVCEKVRNPETGTIERFGIVEDRSNPNLPYVILDDICDGGATFIKLAQLFVTKKIRLYVVHGLFSKGLDDMREAGISEFFCHLTLDKTYPQGVTVLCPV